MLLPIDCFRSTFVEGRASRARRLDNPGQKLDRTVPAAIGFVLFAILSELVAKTNRMRIVDRCRCKKDRSTHPMALVGRCREMICFRGISSRQGRQMRRRQTSHDVSADGALAVDRAQCEAAPFARLTRSVDRKGSRSLFEFVCAGSSPTVRYAQLAQNRRDCHQLKRP